MIYKFILCYNNLKNCAKGELRLKRAFIVLISFSLIVCFLFSSCSSVSLIRPVGSLLAPPLYYPEYEELVEAFNETAGIDNQFCIPHEGDYNSAFVVENIDGDSDDEALIFYKNQNETVAKMQYFDFDNGEWKPVADFSGYGNGVKSVTVSDMDNDGTAELIVIWSTSGVSTGDIMSVYRKNAGETFFREIANEACLISDVLDIDSDKYNEIFYISQSTSGNAVQKSAKALKLSGNSVVIMGETKVDPNISSYVSLKAEKESENSPMKIYVDALKGERQMITEMVFWDSEKSALIAPWLDKDTLTNSITLRYEPVECADINNDGKIDIPVQMEFGISESQDKLESEKLYLTAWVNYDEDNAAVVSNTLINLSDGYIITLTDEEVDLIGVRVYKQKNCWVVYIRDELKNTDEAIFSVIKIDKNNWDEEKFSSYIPIAERNDGVVCVYITETGKDLGITEETIRNKIARLP